MESLQILNYENCGSCKIKKEFLICVYREAWVRTASSFLPASVSRHLSTSGWSSQRPKTRPFLRPASFLLRETRWILWWRAKTLRSKREGRKATDRKLKTRFSEWVGGHSHRTCFCVCLQCFERIFYIFLVSHSRIFELKNVSCIFIALCICVNDKWECTRKKCFSFIKNQV